MGVDTAGSGDRAYVSVAGAAIAGALAAPSLARRLARHTSPLVAETVVLGGAMAAAQVTLIALERRSPYSAAWARSDGREAADLASLAVLLPLESVVSHAVAGAIADRVGRRLPRARCVLADGLPLVVRLAAALLISDLAHYAHHRASHRFGPLWRLHAEHHRARRMTWLNATRFHPIDMVPLQISQDLPLLVLGMGADTRLAHRLAKGVHGQLQHANVSGRAPRLGRILSTTEQHRLHHAAGAVPSNFGGVLSVWDRVFGTHAERPVAEPVTEVGLPGR